MDIFEKEMQKKTVFKNRDVLSPHYLPETLPYREKEIEKVMKVLAPSLKGRNYNNLFIYGKTGTGKTSVTKYVLEKLMQVKEKYNANVDSLYMNCRIINTKYQVLLKFAEHYYPDENFLGFPLQHLVDRIIKKINKSKLNTIVVLDELDKIKNLDDLMYTLTRMNDEIAYGHVGIIGITNNIAFKKKLDPRTKSTLCEDEMVFAPYNAEQLKEILKQRALEGFKKGSVEESALSYAAALAAQESGDARYALKLLQKAGEVADSEEESRVLERHVKKARKSVEEEIVYDVVSTLPEHQRVTLYAIALLTKEGKKYARLDGSYEDRVLFSGEVYEKYEMLCHVLGKDARSARWVREYLNGLEMLGLITTSISGKGIRGNTTLIRLAFPADNIKRVVEKSFENN